MPSFYVGPDRPVLRVADLGDLLAAADAGVLTETQWVELKAALPGVSGATLELAKDLASLSVDGGVLVVGVRDPGQSAADVVGFVEDLESLKDRVSQVAVGRVQPPLNVTFTALTAPGDPARHLLLVTVPASGSGPHMVDERYWGRSATGKRPLSDVEASRLWAQRRRSSDDFTQRLQTRPDDVPQLWPSQQLGLMHLMLEPPPRHSDLRGRPVGLTTVLNAASFQPAWTPGLTDLTTPLPHPDGQGFAPFEPDPTGRDAHRFLHLLVLDSGALRLLAPATQPWRRATSDEPQQQHISVNRLMELTHQAVELAATIGHDHLLITGTWTVGVHLDGLAGVHSAQSLSEAFYTFRGRPYPRSSYTRSTSASGEQLQDRPAEIVESLLGDLARGLALDKMLFPYSDPSDIQRRGAGW